MILKISCVLALLFAFSSCQKTNENSSLDASSCNCMSVFNPVCGEDGKTYSNQCLANCHKVKHSPGECSKK